MKETKEQRSRIMRAVKSSDTAPELTVRRVAHRMGFRFRLYREDLPGKPDLTFMRLHKVLFVHGCFWHGHDCKRGARVPKRNRAYWMKKVSGNRERDQKNLEELAAAGWEYLIVWECEVREERVLKAQIRKFLREP
jgi:DNA mismatch endonuclease (patch repair protein)